MTARRLPATLAALLTTFGCGAGPGVIGTAGDAGDDAALPDDAAAPPDAVPPDAVVPTVPREVDGRLTINELMTANALTVADDLGAASDWIELYNPTDQDLALHGYALTDALGHPLASVLPAGVVIPAGGHLVLWADGAPSLGATHLGFRLDDDGGEVGLARPDGSYIDRVRYGAQEVDVAAARAPDGSDRWRIEWLASPGAANPDGDGAPVGLDDEAAPPEEIPAAPDLGERVLGYDVIPALDLTVSPAAAASLEADPFTYVPALVTIDGRTYGPVGLRLKGQNSFQPFSAKPSLRIKVDHYTEGARLLGLEDLTLNNMDDDFSMMHERLAYLVARAAQVAASRANHLWLTVNGQAYGLYSNVETVKKRMLRRWFEDASGPLFEATDVDFVAADVAAYELESGPDDRSLLSGLAEALTLASPDAAIAAAAAFADLDQFRRYWAVCSVIAQFDAFPYSDPGDDYFVYADPARGLAFLPWGMDETFYSSQLDVTATRSVLAARCQASPACFQAYVDEVFDVVAMIEAMDLEAERVRVAAQIEPFVVLDPRRPYPLEQVHAFQGQLYWFINGRRLDLDEMLPPPTP